MEVQFLLVDSCFRDTKRARFVDSCFHDTKRARNSANFHCCRLEQHGVIEVWLQILSADKFGTNVSAWFGNVPFEAATMFPAYTIW
jgi:hypothetical protein